MIVTYTVALEMEEPNAEMLVAVALDLEDDLRSAGWDVEAVKPWARPSLAAPSLNPTPIQLPPTIQ